jgi:hypothetical protein
MRRTALSLGPRDWNKYIENGKFFHQRSSDGWASATYGTDLMQQVDPEFSYQALYEQKKEAA